VRRLLAISIIVMAFFMCLLIVSFGQSIIFPGPGSGSLGGPITVVESQCMDSHSGPAPCVAGGSGSYYQLNLGTSTTAGELIVVRTWGGPGGTAYGSVTDSAGQTYTQGPTVGITGLASHYDATIFSKCNSAAGVSWVQWTFGSGDTYSYAWMGVTHVQNLATSCADAAANYTAAQGTPFTGPATGTTGYPNEFIFAPVDYYTNTGTTISATGAWAIPIQGTDASSFQHGFLTQTVSSVGSYAATGTGTGASTFYILAVKSFHQ
jgi:hypothetical protein